jgi:sarcosine oxidase subunit delta
MLQIPCPFCGVRDETEFRFGGEAHRATPPLTSSDEEWSDYLFSRRNPKGIHFEVWCHSYGCGRWFNMVRDTVTHTVHAVYPMGEQPPCLPGASP